MLTIDLVSSLKVLITKGFCWSGIFYMPDALTDARPTPIVSVMKHFVIFAYKRVLLLLLCSEKLQNSTIVPVKLLVF